jgi:hypothetical protein
VYANNACEVGSDKDQIIVVSGLPTYEFITAAMLFVTANWLRIYAQGLTFLI